MRPLKTGYAYHGNRMLNHAEADLKDMAMHNGNVVVHMLSHTDWERHKDVMKDMVAITHGLGMEAWMDNWGLAGAPGDKSHFLSYYPDAHAYYSDGSMAPTTVCLNSPEFRQFTKEWIDVVEYTGAKKIFWDEPHLPDKKADDKVYFSCACKRCKKLFEEKYGYPMPVEANDDVNRFRLETIADYFKDVTAYSHAKGIENSVCVMLGSSGVSLENAEPICAIDTIEDIGSDPYWLYSKCDPYEYVYKGTKRNLDLCAKYNKNHNLWIQTYSNPVGRENEIIAATEACYDAGARTILAWGYYGSVSNDYRAKNPLVTKVKTEEAFRRIWDMEFDRLHEENKRKMKENM